MWDVSLYAVNVLVSVVNKEAELANSQADYSQEGNPIEMKGEKGQSQRDVREARYELISHKPCGKIQNKNVLI